MRIVGWWSQATTEILVALDGRSAQQIHNWLIAEEGKGRIVPPVVKQMQQELRGALQTCPPELR